jgi:hypothetical protein
LSGNTTLTSLPNGEHTLTIYVSDVAGNLEAAETIFIIEPFPTALVATASGSLAIACAGLLVYFKKHNR